VSAAEATSAAVKEAGACCSRVLQQGQYTRYHRRCADARLVYGRNRNRVFFFCVAPDSAERVYALPAVLGALCSSPFSTPVRGRSCLRRHVCSPCGRCSGRFGCVEPVLDLKMLCRSGVYRSDSVAHEPGCWSIRGQVLRLKDCRRLAKRGSAAALVRVASGNRLGPTTRIR